jgi:hypothetical protein
VSKEKVTLTLDVATVAEIRAMVGTRSLSSFVDAAIAERLAHMKHLRAVDEWLAELDSKHGPIPPETLEWAARVVGDWETGSKRRRRAG